MKVKCDNALGTMTINCYGSLINVSHYYHCYCFVIKIITQMAVNSGMKNGTSFQFVVTKLWNPVYS